MNASMSVRMWACMCACIHVYIYLFVFVNRDVGKHIYWQVARFGKCVIIGACMHVGP